MTYLKIFHRPHNFKPLTFNDSVGRSVKSITFWRVQVLIYLFINFFLTFSLFLVQSYRSSSNFYTFASMLAQMASKVCTCHIFNIFRHFTHFPSYLIMSLVFILGNPKNTSLIIYLPLPKISFVQDFTTFTFTIIASFFQVKV